MSALGSNFFDDFEKPCFNLAKFAPVRIGIGKNYLEQRQRLPMKINSLFYLFFAFFSALGDTVFLFGIPLYLYQENGKQLTFTALVPFIIIFTIFVFKKFIFKVNHLNALFLVSAGELAMFFLELILLLLLKNFSNSTAVILIMLLPLALTYNTYSASKRIKIQDYFFQENKVFMNGVFSTVDRLGRLAGFFLAGIVLENFNILGLIAFDSLTFFSFGLFIFYTYLKKKNEPPISTVLQGDDEKNVIPNSNLHIKLIFALVISLNLFLSWENSSFVASIQRNNDLNISILAQQKALLNLAGLLLGLSMLNLLSKLIVPVFYFFSGAFVFCLFFFKGIYLFNTVSILVGIFSILMVSFQRGLIKKIADNKRSLSEVSTSFWYFQVLTSFSILPINYLSDKFSFLQTTSLLIFLYIAIGLLAGYFISKFYLAKIHFENQ